MLEPETHITFASPDRSQQARTRDHPSRATGLGGAASASATVARLKILNPDPVSSA
jgi:hypothetical protein